METIIRDKLTAAFAPLILDIQDESTKHAGHSGARPGQATHFRVKIVAHAFDSLSLLERHRRVYDTLGQELANQIHALSLSLLSPNETNDPTT